MRKYWRNILQIVLKWSWSDLSLPHYFNMGNLSLIICYIITHEYNATHCSNCTKWSWGWSCTYPEICMVGLLGCEGQMMFIWRSDRVSSRSVGAWTPSTPSNSSTDATTTNNNNATLFFVEEILHTHNFTATRPWRISRGAPGKTNNLPPSMMVKTICLC